jgi:hypothetical protein
MILLRKEKALNFWPEIKDRIKKSLIKSNDNTPLEKIYNDILQDYLQLWIVIDENYYIIGVGVSEFVYINDKKILSVYLFEADNIKIAIKAMNDLIEWAHDKDIAAIETTARVGWEKFLKQLDFKKKEVLLRRNINGKTQIPSTSI